MNLFLPLGDAHRSFGHLDDVVVLGIQVGQHFLDATPGPRRNLGLVRGKHALRGEKHTFRRFDLGSATVAVSVQGKNRLLLHLSTDAGVQLEGLVVRGVRVVADVQQVTVVELTQGVGYASGRAVGHGAFFHLEHYSSWNSRRGLNRLGMKCASEYKRLNEFNIIL